MFFPNESSLPAQINVLLTFDCSANPVIMTMTCSAMNVLASSGKGMQVIHAAPSVIAVWVRVPISSHDISRMCPIQSVNSFGLWSDVSIKVQCKLSKGNQQPNTTACVNYAERKIIYIMTL